MGVGAWGRVMGGLITGSLWTSFEGDDMETKNQPWGRKPALKDTDLWHDVHNTEPFSNWEPQCSGESMADAILMTIAVVAVLGSLIVVFI